MGSLEKLNFVVPRFERKKSYKTPLKTLGQQPYASSHWNPVRYTGFDAQRFYESGEEFGRVSITVDDFPRPVCGASLRTACAPLVVHSYIRCQSHPRKDEQDCVHQLAGMVEGRKNLPFLEARYLHKWVKASASAARSLGSLLCSPVLSVLFRGPAGKADFQNGCATKTKIAPSIAQSNRLVRATSTLPFGASTASRW
jgi:hypothetical protein